MNFRTYDALEAMVDSYNQGHPYEEFELWFPHMYSEGKWAVNLVFGKCPDLNTIAPFLSFCKANGLDAFFMIVHNSIALHIQ